MSMTSFCYRGAKVLSMVFMCCTICIASFEPILEKELVASADFIGVIEIIKVDSTVAGNSSSQGQGVVNIDVASIKIENIVSGKVPKPQVKLHAWWSNNSNSWPALEKGRFLAFLRWEPLGYAAPSTRLSLIEIDGGHVMWLNDKGALTNRKELSDVIALIKSYLVKSKSDNP